MLKFLHLSLAFLVLVGSTGVTVNRHYCMGELKSVAIFGEAKKCHKAQDKPHCPFHPQPTEADEEGTSKKCCDDQHELLQVDDQELTYELAPPPLAAVLPDFPPRLFNYLPPHPRPRKNTRFENYRPPPLLLDPVREFQVFRL